MTVPLILVLKLLLWTNLLFAGIHSILILVNILLVFNTVCNVEFIRLCPQCMGWIYPMMKDN